MRTSPADLLALAIARAKHMQDEITQADKRRVLKDDRASTYYAMAEATAGEELGRYKHLGKASVTGAVPKLPASSPWCSDPVPNEEPTGIDLNQQEAVGTQAEINASLPKAESSSSSLGLDPAPLSNASDDRVERGPPSQLRRL
jgi:hypothetical protein